MKYPIAIGLIALSAASRAQIYDNGPPNLASGDQVTEYLEADSFVLGTAGTVGSVQFWDIETVNAPNDGNISWAIAADNSGSPGTILDSGTTSYTHDSTGRIAHGAFNEYVDNFTLNTPFAAAAGTSYWLELHANPSENFASYDGIYWETSAASNFGMYNEFGTSGWNSDQQAFAYQLFGSAAPEPVSVTLLACGAIGLAIRKRRNAK